MAKNIFTYLSPPCLAFYLPRQNLTRPFFENCVWRGSLAFSSRDKKKKVHTREPFFVRRHLVVPFPAVACVSGGRTYLPPRPLLLQLWGFSKNRNLLLPETGAQSHLGAFSVRKKKASKFGGSEEEDNRGSQNLSPGLPVAKTDIDMSADASTFGCFRIRGGGRGRGSRDLSLGFGPRQNGHPYVRRMPALSEILGFRGRQRNGDQVIFSLDFGLWQTDIHRSTDACQHIPSPQWCSRYALRAPALVVVVLGTQEKTFFGDVLFNVEPYIAGRDWTGTTRKKNLEAFSSRRQVFIGVRKASAQPETLQD